MVMKLDEEVWRKERVEDRRDTALAGGRPNFG